jgi:hypothetical protein
VKRNCRKRKSEKYRLKKKMKKGIFERKWRRNEKGQFKRKA